MKSSAGQPSYRAAHPRLSAALRSDKRTVLGLHDPYTPPSPRKRSHSRAALTRGHGFRPIALVGQKIIFKPNCTWRIGATVFTILPKLVFEASGSHVEPGEP